METTYTIDQIRRLVAPIAKQYGVEKVYLFGSYATNSATFLERIAKDEVLIYEE